MPTDPQPQGVPTFQYVIPTDDQRKQMSVYRDKFDELYQDISKNIVESRGKSLALTKLEEAAMWLNKGITNNS